MEQTTNKQKTKFIRLQIEKNYFRGMKFPMSAKSISMRSLPSTFTAHYKLNSVKYEPRWCLAIPRRFVLLHFADPHILPAVVNSVLLPSKDEAPHFFTFITLPNRIY